MQLKVYEKQIQNLNISDKYKNLMLGHMAKYIKIKQSILQKILSKSGNKKLQLKQNSNFIIKGLESLNFVEQQIKTKQHNKIKNQEDKNKKYFNDKNYQIGEQKPAQQLQQVSFILNTDEDSTKNNPSRFSIRQDQKNLSSFNRNKIKCQKQISNCKQDPILSLCRKHIRICSNAIKQSKLKQAQIIRKLIHKTLSEICYRQQNQNWKVLKIRTVLLRLQLIFAKLHNNQNLSNLSTLPNNYNKYEVQIQNLNEKQLQFIHRIPLFCKQLKKDTKYYQKLQQDYYSYIQILYFNAIRSYLFKKYKNMKLQKICYNKTKNNQNLCSLINFNQITVLIQDATNCLIKQLKNLCSMLIQMEDKKIFKIITQKCQTLLKIYGLQLAFIYVNDEAQNQINKLQSLQSIQTQIYTEENISQQNGFHLNNHKGTTTKNTKAENITKRKFMKIKNSIWNKYDKIFRNVPNSLNEQQIQNIVFQTFMIHIELADKNKSAKYVEKSQLFSDRSPQQSQDTQSQNQLDLQQIQLQNQPKIDLEGEKSFKFINFPQIKQTHEQIQTIVQQSCQQQLNSNQYIEKNNPSHISSNTKSFITSEDNNSQDSKLSTNKQICLANLYAKMEPTIKSNLNQLKIKRFSSLSAQKQQQAQNYKLIKPKRSRYMSIQSKTPQISFEPNNINIKKSEQNLQQQKILQLQVNQKNINLGIIRPTILIKRSNNIIDNNFGQQTEQVQTIQLEKNNKQESNYLNSLKPCKEKTKKKVTILESLQNKIVQNNNNNEQGYLGFKKSQQKKYLNLPSLTNNQQRSISIDLKCYNSTTEQDKKYLNAVNFRQNLLNMEEKTSKNRISLDKNKNLSSNSKTEDFHYNQLKQNNTLKKQKLVLNDTKIGTKAYNLKIFRMAKSRSLQYCNKKQNSNQKTMSKFYNLSTQNANKNIQNRRSSKSLSLFAILNQNQKHKKKINLNQKSLVIPFLIGSSFSQLSKNIPKLQIKR